MKLSSKPTIPKGYDWTVEYHNGITEMPEKIELHLEPEQEKGYIKGKVLVERMKEKGLNANHLEYLLEHPKLIPDEWKDKWVYFWGTIYRDSVRDLFVRCLCWHGDRWSWRYGWLGSGWHGSHPAAVSASTLSSEPQSSSPVSLELRIEALEQWKSKVEKSLSSLA